MDIWAASEASYKNGYAAGKTSALDTVSEGIEKFLTEEGPDVIISEGEVYVPISAVRQLISDIASVTVD
jgi:hypothetical protein